MTDRAAILVELTRLTAADSGHRHLAERLCTAGRLILGADGAWITIAGDSDSKVTLCTTDDVATRLDDLQDLVRQGPCLEALHTGTPTSAKVDKDADGRWPEFVRAACRAVGALTMHAFPMKPGAHPFGVLGLYCRGEKNRLAEPLETGQFVANAVGAALLKDPPPNDLAPRTDTVWAKRSEIHQATGMVAAQLRLPAGDAAAILRAHAYAHDTTLADVAHQVIDRHLKFHDE